MILSYDGSAFFGWQIQPGAVSVQETLEKGLSVLLRRRIRVVGAGRTDTGVNASYYVAHFDFDGEIADTAQLAYRLGCVTGGNIAVREIRRVRDDFHARFSATRRTYRYYVHDGRDPFLEKFSYGISYARTDFDAMNRAAELIRGTRDFSCFEKSGGGNRTSLCTVYDAGWHRYCPEPGSGTQCHYFEVSADRFLRNMVRAMVGTLLEVGRGRRVPESVRELFLSADRCMAGQSVPGNALFLTGIEYPGDFGL